jgi:AMMECR1 domain-containing protein
MESAEVYLHAMRLARAYLDALIKGSKAVPVPEFNGSPALRLNVTLRSRGVLRGSMSGTGESLRAQVLDAVDRASLDQRFSGAVVTADLRDVLIELWIQIATEAIPVSSRRVPGAISLGEDGVEICSADKFAYFKPSVALTRSYDQPSKLLTALCKKAGLPCGAWESPEVIVNKTAWLHFCETPTGQPYRLRALRPIDPVVMSRELLQSLLLDTATYLANAQKTDGSFCYKYDPFDNRARSRKPNAVRASGCCYAMAAAASWFMASGDSRFVGCAQSAIEAVLVRLEYLADNTAYVRDLNDPSHGGRLGTTALCALALFLAPLSDPRYPAIADVLVNGIKSLQVESGSFECCFGGLPSQESHKDYFPGQALLVLIEKSKAGDDSCAAAYRRAFRPYRDHFRRRPTTAFVGWQADAWSRAALCDRNEEYADFVFEQIDWLLAFQDRKLESQLTYGSFIRTGSDPTSSSIVFTEAVARAAILAHHLGDNRWRHYRSAYLAGLRFCLLLRLTEAQAIFFPHPRRAFGGITRSLTNFQVRSDMVQHAITLSLLALSSPLLSEFQER